MLTSWHFEAGGDILGQKHIFSFFTKQMRKTGIKPVLQNSRDSSKAHNAAWFTSERVLNKTCDSIMNEILYL